ncbi:hypothetical protein DBV15_11068 [Temnothorax longispinosus]|uniref:Uncharacterized protein n=1 Tax=Temnothorax longispinosus TaxID=300112 RepID=A0A4S2KU88_9HYME|nr:hypothetical protein DBV15_11068 [Temnothorax longispinosus]
MTSSPFKSTRNSRVNAEGRRTRLNTPMNEYGRVQRQLRCHKAPIVKTPLHEVPVADARATSDTACSREKQTRRQRENEADETEAEYASTRNR